MEHEADLRARLAETLSGDRRQGAARGVGGGARQLEQQLEEQAASLERLRAARNSTAQQRMAAIEAENRLLKERRKAP